jgi:hypothetical protein
MDYKPQKNFLVHLLKYHENEAEGNISNIVWKYREHRGIDISS